MHRLLKTTGSLCLVALMSLAGIYLWLRSSLPSYTGEASVTGIGAPLDITRDRHAVPHIFGKDENDTAFGLGYAHAQDRLWQMEISRRVGHGRLAEVLGKEALAEDEKVRTLGLAQAAQHTIARLDTDTLAWLQSYASGVNAFVATRPALPPEFSLFGIEPQPWQPLDSVVVFKVIAYELAGNWQREATRAHLFSQLEPQLAAEFLNLNVNEEIFRNPELQTLYAQLPLRQLVTLQPPKRDGVGSNNWVVGPKRSVTGKALLADDPHVFLSAPGFWYLAHLSTGGRNVIGGTVPGLPSVIVGRNDRVAWGVTDSTPDVQDLYVEKLKDDDATAYLTPEGWRRFNVRREVIHVKDEPDVVLQVQESRHGPVVSNLVGTTQAVTPGGHVIALAWTALAHDDVSLRAFRYINQAQSAAEFKAGLHDLGAPQLSFVYADVDGSFGFMAPGRVPVRDPGNRVEGRLPVPGWDALYDWQGYVPYEALPRSENPERQAAWTANSRIVADDYPYLMTHDWAYPHRADRIAELLAAQDQHSMESFKAIQADVISLRTRELLPLMLKRLPKSVAHPEIVAALTAWDGSAGMERPEQAIYAAWYERFSALLHADEFGELTQQYPSADPPFIANVLSDVGGQARWCDDVRTKPDVEDCGALLESTLQSAIADLQQRLGGDWREWQWGRLHRARGVHVPLSGTPVLGSLLDIVISAPGGEGTVNVGGYDSNFEMVHGASLRTIFDLADIEQSLFMSHTGQSGHFLSRHYDDLTPLWRDTQYIRIPVDRRAIENGSIGTLRLRPAAQ